MNRRRSDDQAVDRVRLRWMSWWAALAVVVATYGCASSASTSSANLVTSDEAKAAAAPAGPETPRDQARELAERWGVEVVAIRLTAAGYMLDFRYRVLDPDKAAPLFDRHDKPVVIHHPTGARMPVHNPAKTGPLRPTNPPEAGRIYFIMFANARGVVQPGDEVTVEIGEFSVDLVVEG